MEMKQITLMNKKNSKCVKLKGNEKNWKENPNFIGCSVEKKIDKLETVGLESELDTPVKCFESVYNSDIIINRLIEMSNKYALKKNHVLNVTQEEMKVYIIFY